MNVYIFISNKLKTTNKRKKMIKILLLALLWLSSSLYASKVDSMLDKVSNTNKNSISSQIKINSYSEKSEKLYDEYALLSKQLNEQKLYNKRLSLFVSTQNNEIPKLQKQLTEIVQTHKKIIPLMFEMVETLDKLLQADSPFLTNERTRRIENLKSYLSNSDIEMSQQYRMIMEAYKTEYGYARTLEVYRAQLDSDDSKTVDFLRVGRFALYYQSLDRQESAIYNLETQQWIILEESYNHNISKAIKMARKKVAPDFLTLPILSAKANK